MGSKINTGLLHAAKVRCKQTQWLWAASTKVMWHNCWWCNVGLTFHAESLMNFQWVQLIGKWGHSKYIQWLPKQPEPLNWLTVTSSHSGTFEHLYFLQQSFLGGKYLENTVRVMVILIMVFTLQPLKLRGVLASLCWAGGQAAWTSKFMNALTWDWRDVGVSTS